MDPRCGKKFLNRVNYPRINGPGVHIQGGSNHTATPYRVPLQQRLQGEEIGSESSVSRGVHKDKVCEGNLIPKRKDESTLCSL